MRQKQLGITLMEITIVCFLVGIITAIAIPNYRTYSLRVNRQAAIGDMQSIQQLMERQYNINNGQYTDPFPGENSSCTQTGKLTSGSPPRYTFAIAVEPQSYTITATACEGQDQDSCGNLRLSSDGTRQVTKEGTTFLTDGKCF